MALILNIDTATENASVSLTSNGVSLGYLYNPHQKEHASFVHAAIAEVLKTAGYTLNNVEAFAVTSGPGSYTGLRVGMAAAKGFCYAFNKPLIAINTLEVMTKAALDAVTRVEEDQLFCPMIDARRMEVFTGIYNRKIEVVFAPQAMVLEKETFKSYITNKKILFFGSGSRKFKELQGSEDELFVDISYNAQHLGMLADRAFLVKNFSDISYSGPNYFKDFHSTAKV